MTPGRWYPLAEIAGGDLPAALKVELLATAMWELALAEALVMIHGPKAGLTLYYARGGRVYPDGDGVPAVWGPA